MRRGVRLAIDVGAVRIGVAASDPDGILATPVETVQRDAADVAPSLSRMAEIIAEREPIVLYVGLPRTLKGTEGAAATAAREFAHALIPRVSVPIQLVDEDRKSTRLNSSHVAISYAVFCLKKKKPTNRSTPSHQNTKG